MTDEHEVHHISRGTWVFYGFLAIMAALLFMEHRVHVLGFLPYLFLLACPLMHLFMHHNHGGAAHRNHHHDASTGEQK